MRARTARTAGRPARSASARRGRREPLANPDARPKARRRLLTDRESEPPVEPQRPRLSGCLQSSHAAPASGPLGLGEQPRADPLAHLPGLHEDALELPNARGDDRPLAEAHDELATLGGDADPRLLDRARRQGDGVRLREQVGDVVAADQRGSQLEVLEQVPFARPRAPDVQARGDVGPTDHAATIARTASSSRTAGRRAEVRLARVV